MQFTLKLTAIELTPYTYHIGIHGKAGRKKVRMIIDTGASQTVISTQLAEKLKLETFEPEQQNITVGIGEGTLNPKFTILKSLSFDDLKITNIPAIILSLDHINSTYATIGQESIDGIIGNDLLIALGCRLNLSNMTMKVKTKKKIFNLEKYIFSIGDSRQI